MDGDLSLVGLGLWVGLGWNIRVPVGVPDYFILFEQIISFYVSYLILYIFIFIYVISYVVDLIGLLGSNHIKKSQRTKRLAPLGGEEIVSSLHTEKLVVSWSVMLFI